MTYMCMGVMLFMPGDIGTCQHVTTWMIRFDDSQHHVCLRIEGRSSSVRCNVILSRVSHNTIYETAFIIASCSHMTYSHGFYMFLNLITNNTLLTKITIKHQYSILNVFIISAGILQVIST